MGQIIPYGAIRTLRACKDIESSSQEILKGLGQMSDDADRARNQLADAARRLEETLVHYGDAQRKLQAVQDNYLATMKLVDEIMSTSQAFQK
ncbi:hypothetical protein [Insolitispirillum peregrinum]|uniref:Uncharacterized protein n=1 Tax=Insolitispirillum peregrinum TaxID=80876 RepID=A0A1N7IRC0_9PROT|nr:hypothetical protein [Insolitispirillum peregrinum]SIS39620.1 hypothetical protein SAMN05421779_101517 [Insolitispirillum peregrinum]